MDLNDYLENFRDWLPVRGFWENDRAFVDWCFLGKERLTEPFFDDSIVKRFRLPFNLLFRHQTPIEFLEELPGGIGPTGFIFHLSRCGSTLISQMLAALRQNIVISEAAPLDFVIRKTPGIPEAERIKWLRWMVNALGQPRNPGETNYFIKFDSWNTLGLPLIKRAFPDVPWIFLYRDPVEIIVSHMRQRGAHMIPGLIPEILPGLELEERLKMSPEEYCARVLGAICRSASKALKTMNGLAVDYTELPAAVPTRILHHFGVLFEESEINEMLKAARFSAKNPSLTFSSDTAQKRKEAGFEIRTAVQKFVGPYFAGLEEFRQCPNLV